MGLSVKKGDNVRVMTGKDAGVTGRVILTMPKAQRVLVEGVNRIRKHTKITTNQRGAQSGGIVTQEAPVHVSNARTATTIRPLIAGTEASVAASCKGSVS